uniref:DHC_N2 domain-containing protein n=7 Tax=Mesocestoides corti TaxID=53468 RepID=A0A5K3F9C0_MESCO
MQTLDDNSISLQSMGASTFSAPFITEIRTLEKQLSQVSEVLELWTLVQRKWLHLEGIFSAGDIRSHLPKEAEKFDKLDSLFKQAIQDAAKEPEVSACCL